MGDKDWIVFGASLKWPFKELQIIPKKAFIKKIRKKICFFDLQNLNDKAE